MTAIISLLSTGKGTWAHAIRLMESEEFDRAIVLTNSFGKERYNPPGKATVVELDLRKPTKELKEDIKKALMPLIAEEMEVALNIASGTGIEHMAVIAALFESGVGFRLAMLSPNGPEYI